MKKNMKKNMKSSYYCETAKLAGEMTIIYLILYKWADGRSHHQYTPYLCKLAGDNHAERAYQVG